MDIVPSVRRIYSESFAALLVVYVRLFYERNCEVPIDLSLFRDEGYLYRSATALQDFPNAVTELRYGIGIAVPVRRVIRRRNVAVRAYRSRAFLPIFEWYVNRFCVVVVEVN